ncbi:MAG: ATP-binding cassette domain-containing protein [Candidatus Pacebacteria bacterium]|nr:ATP-binding cassette domain-containing protein [Candidatus Paceibacterota bacterium]
MKKEEQERRDPVCGMDLSDLEEYLTVKIQGDTFYFCSEPCAKRFKSNPEKFKGDPLIHLHDLWKVFHDGSVETQVLRAVNIHIWDGDFAVIIGASGSGKSTLLNMIGMLDRPTRGGLYLGEKNISKTTDDDRTVLRSSKFGFVFQQYNLIPWLTAYDNVVLPLIFSEKGDGLRRADLEKRFSDIGLANRGEHRPAELSGGEQQRVALLRALANDPEIIIGDEPTGNLDSVTGEKILDMLIALNKKEKKTLIIVTHDADIAKRADQVITIKDGKTIPGHLYHTKTYTE